MKIGVGIPIPNIANLPGVSRPGGGGSVTDPVPFMYKTAVAANTQTDTGIYRIKKTGGNMTVDWGDGATTTLTAASTTPVLHTYNDGNNNPVENPVVKIGLDGDTGTLTEIYYQAGSTTFASELLEIQQWGTKHAFTSLNFSNSTQMQLTATDLPTTNTLAGTFLGCTAFTGNSSMNSWDTSNVISLNATFQQCSNFNQDLYNWDTSNVTSFRNCFYANTNFNGNINGWDFTSGIILSNMLALARNFNQPVNNWDLSGVNKNCSAMLQDANDFNQDISSWDVSKITNATYMLDNTAFASGLSSWQFTNATTLHRMLFQQSVFNENIGSMALGANLTDMQYMFFQATGLSSSNWTSTIVGWANQVANNSAPYNVNAANIATQATLNFDNSADGGSNFTNAGEARDYLAGATAGWTITGDTRIN